ncbi:hypothetical protein A2917_00455 [Candidatus Nomurabacteria bacterium RIFCSPLOWO2_01_FULL_42_17]|uniref:Fibronectin type-III domain-containing protein n=1 Tax=Candidatus Nomurabacteria bacterium RIFCSPLOWO2_01_FULL_42_17 TaxID=1801780 RepID=A0A1F6XNV4_9BACT|nr:MAG: hypothetical protein A2917_00455 [Candidatus Nomurabacteria bacterium RIFCSPLOWO2_01_FULL_42_17]
MNVRSYLNVAIVVAIIVIGFVSVILLIENQSLSPEGQTAQVVSSTPEIIGYMGVDDDDTTGCLLQDQNTGKFVSKLPIYKIYNQNQYSNSKTKYNNCLDYFKLDTNDQLQLICYKINSEGQAVDYLGPVLKGPGTFTGKDFPNSDCASRYSQSRSDSDYDKWNFHSGIVKLIPTQEIIGYMGINEGESSSCSFSKSGGERPMNSSYPELEVPIYKINNQAQYFFSEKKLNGCINYVKLKTNDSIQVICDSASPNREESTMVLTGPGVFSPDNVPPHKCSKQATGTSITRRGLFTLDEVRVLASPIISNPPSNLTAKVAAFDKINLSWKDNSSNETNFQIERATETEKKGEFGPFGPIDILAPNKSSYADSGLTGNTSYAYRVRASLGATGYSDYSNTVSAKTLSPDPSNLTAKVILDRTKAGVELKWQDNSTNELGFTVQRKHGNGEWEKLPGATVYPFLDNFNTSPVDFPDESYRVYATFPDGSISGYSNEVSVNNCAKISGTGPRQFVFMKGKSIEKTPSDYFTSTVNPIVKQGFGTISPFKDYLSQFSFFVDLQNFDDSAFSTYVYGGKNYFGTDGFLDSTLGVFESSLKEESACADMVAQNSVHIFSFAENFRNLHLAWALPTLKMAFVSGERLNTAMHEVGHVIGDLRDEYKIADTPSTFWGGWESNPRNCSLVPFIDFRSSLDNRIYGGATAAGTGFEGCGYLKSKFGLNFYRPSQDGLMNENNPLKFNCISYGYIVAAIKGEPTTKANAQKYWPECLAKSDTIKEGLPELGNPPKIKTIQLQSQPNATSSLPSLMAAISSIWDSLSLPASALLSLEDSSKGIAAGSSTGASSEDALYLVISGSGFTKEANSVQLIDIKDKKKVYELLSISSADGKTISVKIPATVPMGTYNLKVGAFNSKWSNVLKITIAPLGKIVVNAPPSGGSYKLGSSVPISWNAKNVKSTKISVYKDGVSKLVINKGYIQKTPDGAVAWIIPKNFPLGNYKIRVADSAKPAIFAESGVFSIVK